MARGTDIDSLYTLVTGESRLGSCLCLKWITVMLVTSHVAGTFHVYV